MPIRLNLLAEAQAAEDMRRRDPVKRAIWLAGLLVAAMLAWSGWVQTRVVLAGRVVTRGEKQVANLAKEFQEVLDNQKKSGEIHDKLVALQRLTTNRFLNAPMLNALQETIVEDVHLTRLRVEQGYTLTEEIKNKTNSSGRVTIGKPATVTERIVLTLEARDFAPNPGDQVTPFREKIASHSYFQNMLGKTNEVQMADFQSPTVGPDGRAFRQFTLKCRYPERTR